MQSLSICVFCGSRSGRQPAYEDAATELGQGLAERKWRLVYGAGDVGIMGRVAQTVQQNKSEALGVIPIHLMEKEVAKTDLNNLIVTENMHERKKLMFTNSDAIILMPGGPGSLDEFFEVLTWAQLEVHKKPIVVINVKKYWDPLFSLIDHTISSGFAENSLKKLFTTTETATEAVDYLIKQNQRSELDS